MKRLSRRLMAWLLCCVFLAAASPVSATTTEESTPAVSETVTEQQSEVTTAEAVTSSIAETTTQSTTVEDTATEAGNSEEATSVEPNTTVEAGTVEGTAASSEETTSIEANTTVEEETVESTTANTEASGTEEDFLVSENSAAQALYERIMACATYAEYEELMSTLTDEEMALMDDFTGSQNFVMKHKIGAMKGTESLSNLGRYDFTQGTAGTVRLGTYSGLVRESMWFSVSQPESGITLIEDSDGWAISIAPDTPAGVYTVKYSFSRAYTGWQWWWGQQIWDTAISNGGGSYIIRVKEENQEYAMIFIPKTSTSDPSQSSTDDWFQLNDKENVSVKAVVDMTGATWVDGKDVYNPEKYIANMHDDIIKQSDGSYLVISDGSYDEKWSNIYQNIVLPDLRAKFSDDDINNAFSECEIYLIPYRISRDNETDPDYHIDCIPNVKGDGIYTAIFWVDMPDGTREPVDYSYYLSTASVAKTTNEPTDNDGQYPQTYTDSEGNVYKFVGWFNETGTRIQDKEWRRGYNPSEEDLEDGTVNFYARYELEDEETGTVDPTLTEKSMVFALKAPTSDPDQNSTDDWYPQQDDYHALGTATVDMTGATWVDGKEGSEVKAEKNVYNPGKYIVSMPDGMTKQSDGSYLLSKETYSTAWSEIFEAFKSSAEAEYPDTTISEDNAEIYLIPYKISRDNDTEPDYHIDCKVGIKVDCIYTAIFWVDMPDGTRKQVDSAYYLSTQSVAKTTNAPTDGDGQYPQTYTDSEGNVYKFVGWFSENGTTIQDEEWSSGYNPSEEDLEDGVVNFYARYELEEEEVTTEEETTTVEPTTTEEETTTVEPTTTEEETTTVEPTTTEEETTTVEETTTEEETTTVEPTTTEEETTTVEPTTTEEETTTVSPTTTAEETTTVAPTTTVSPTTTAAQTTTDEAKESSNTKVLGIEDYSTVWGLLLIVAGVCAILFVVKEISSKKSK